jgi:hypothetical protein
MKVKDLISKLQEMDQELEIFHDISHEGDWDCIYLPIHGISKIKIAKWNKRNSFVIIDPDNPGFFETYKERLDPPFDALEIL